MATYRQDLIFTVLPLGVAKATVAGQTQVFLDISVVISPRLDSDQSTATLADYPDWAAPGRTWPDTVAAFLPTMQLHLPGLPGAPHYPVAFFSKHRPDAARFAAAFPGSTPVTPYVFRRADQHKIRSAPVGHLVDALQSVYGHLGYATGNRFPTYDELVTASAFGAMGFQQPRGNPGSVGGRSQSGEQRKQLLTQALEDSLAAHKAVPYDLTKVPGTAGTPAAATSMAFLQQQRFLQRGRPKTNALTASPPPPAFDFHQRVAGLQSLPTLLRVLGLVLDLRAGPIPASVVAAWEQAGGRDTAAYVTVGQAFHGAVGKIVGPSTQAHLAKGVFMPRPKDPAKTDHELRMLKVGDPTRYRTVRVDHDSGAVKAMQFANNVTRSRNQDGKLTSTTPDHFALPALRTAGFAVARLGRATQMVATLARQTALQEGFFGNGPAPSLYEDDLVRGYRIDVLDVADGIWRSLMWRQGTVTITGTDPLTVLEEDTIVPVPTTATRSATATTDLYLQETLTRWDGWSLGVPRIGDPFQGAGPTSSDSGSSGFNVTTDWHVPGSSPSGDAETKDANARRLPRLRFGRSYRLRARAVDLAGNALPVSGAPKTVSTLLSPVLRHLRFEPLPAPRSVLLASELGNDGALRPGDSEEVVVIRSESATVDAKTDLDNGTSLRLLLPAQSSVMMAEHHGALDAKIAGRPMEQAVEIYQDLATRDATTVHDGAQLLDGSAPHGTTNPYLYPDFLPIRYLPDVPVHKAMVRNLPVNADKITDATLPFDPAGAAWPAAQAVRIKLARGSHNTWTTGVVPNSTDADRAAELDLVLTKGTMVSALVNSGIDASTLGVMALWEWIELYAKAHHLPPGGIERTILDGAHWMFTPWRKVTFVHAVRTPLLAPGLLLKPTKTAIGQTYATFTGTKTDPTGGTITFSRRSTARVDVQASWSMPVDTGTNRDPVTPQHFTGHAFDIEPARTGIGFVPGIGGGTAQVADAQNLATRHEFHDTKFRSVTYAATATSYYVEYFRQRFDLPLGADPIAALRAAAIAPGVAFEASTVELTLHWTENGAPRSRRLTAAPPGTDPAVAAPTPGDFVVVEDPALNGADPDAATGGTVRVLAQAAVSSAGLTHAVVEFSYVGPTIHTFSDPTADKTRNLHVLNSARPKAPNVLYAVPIYRRTVGATSVSRTGGGLRIYLDRPWWSSGDQERLGVVCWHQTARSGKLAPAALAPYVTQWGYDPVFRSSTVLPGQPTPACFPLATKVSARGALTIEESSTKVDVAGHDVGFDADRGLWYCDLQITDARHRSLTTYTPFVRLALARYQPYSLPGAHLSRVVLVDYAQLAPDRHLTVTGTGATRRATITGRSPRATAGSTHANRMVVTVEERDDRIADDALAWAAATGPTGFHAAVTMTASAASASTDLVTWTASVSLPAGNAKPLRLTFDEYERIEGGTGHGRLAWTESLPLTPG